MSLNLNNRHFLVEEIYFHNKSFILYTDFIMKSGEMNEYRGPSDQKNLFFT